MSDWLNDDGATHNEEEWLTWRSKGIGSSDIPIILELSPYKTKYQLWLEKSGQVKDEFKGNWATQRGKDLEPMVRDWVNQTLRTNFKPENAVNPNNEIFRASADGVDHDAKMILEVKCPSKADHNLAKSGGVPDKYYPQCQWLMMVFGYKILQYVSYNEDYAVVTLYADQVYQEFLKQEAIKFWEHVTNKTIPECQEQIITDNATKFLLDTYEKLKSEKEDLEKRIDEITKTLSGMLTKQKGICFNYTMQWVTRKGSVDYSKIAELKDIDLDKYRKKDSIYFQLKKNKSA